MGKQSGQASSDTLEVIAPDNPEDKESWNKFVSASAQGSVFTTTRYLDALGANYEIRVLKKGKSIQAGMVFARGAARMNRNPLYAKYLGLMYEPMTSPKLSKITARQIKLAEPFVAHSKTLFDFNYVFHPSMTYWTPFYWGGFRQQTAYTYMLPKERGTTWYQDAQNEVRIRHRKSVSEGFQFEHVTEFNDEVLKEQFQVLMAAYLKRNQRPTMSLDRFLTFMKALGPEGKVHLFSVKDATGALTASAVVATDDSCGYFIANGTHPDAPHYANTFLITEMIRQIHEMGLDFDFEGSMIKPIAHFFRFFNGDIVPYSRIWKPGLIYTSQQIVVETAKRALGYRR